MAVSRTREYAADQTSAEVTHNPNELISALSKLETWSKRIPMSDVNPATAHLFIIKPFSGQSFMRLFSTHRSTERKNRPLAGLTAAVGEVLSEKMRLVCATTPPWHHKQWVTSWLC